jgi:hypothetical protein
MPLSELENPTNATNLIFPYQDASLLGDESYCYGLTNWNPPANTETHSGIDLAARYHDLGPDETRTVAIRAPAAGTGYYVYEMKNGLGAASIIVLLQMNDYWYISFTFEPQSADAATNDLQRTSFAVDLSGQNCATGCYFPVAFSKGEWIGDLIVRNVMPGAYPHIHYSFLYKSPSQTLAEAFADNIAIPRNQGTGMPPKDGPGSPVVPVELSGTPTTFYCPYEYSSHAARVIMASMTKLSTSSAPCTCICAYNSVGGDCGICP